MKYTVVGYYPDNNQPWAASASADTWQEAVQICSKDVARGWKVRVCGVIEGDHMMADDMDETLELEGPVRMIDVEKIGDLFKSRINASSFGEEDWREYCEKYDILNPEHKDFHSNLPEHWNTLKSKVLVEVSVARKGSINSNWEYYLIPEDLCEKALMLGEFPPE